MKKAFLNFVYNTTVSDNPRCKKESSEDKKKTAQAVFVVRRSLKYQLTSLRKIRVTTELPLVFISHVIKIVYIKYIYGEVINWCTGTVY